MISLKQLVLLLVVCVFGSGARAEVLYIAVASNFAAAMQEIAADYEQETGQKIAISTGASGKFFAQIKSGAPFQLFFSADQAKPEALEAAGLAVPGSRFTYATGALVLWSAKPALAVANGEVLGDGAFNKLALANPRLAPYGEAAVAVLDRLGLTEATRPHWVQGENIAQTYQFVRSGSADLGFIALSQTLTPGHPSTGSSWVVPANFHPPIRQDAVLLKTAAESAAAQDFLRYMRSARAAEVIERYGYRTDAGP